VTGSRRLALLALLAVTVAVTVAGCGASRGDTRTQAGAGSDAGTRTQAGAGSDVGARRDSEWTLVVFAAASLTEAFSRLGETFETAHPGVSVRFSFAGSSTLAQQITQGAPADVFAAASPATMAQITGAELAEGRPVVFARNRLAIAVPADDPGEITGLRDLAAPGRKVVLCAPQVPCGAAAREALAAAGVSVRPVSHELDVKAALTKVVLGEADAALVYRTDVKAAQGKVRGIEFPESAKAVNDYPIVAVRGAAQPVLAAEFVQLVRSEQGRSVLAQAGFEVP
jgi:molybdate transport system substrate-binding protein